ncbi:MAG: hypothetical protein Q7V31_06475 [Parvibaculum sp.]|uniref:hypothetical protein n=1 Tax=Parvibaculum sp. TaxID=2024848 RepID=UPI00271C06AC|nr:hypothetical protein [Parvibaculum sp.]MDO8838558.1 hypothetical protein [Parvibaculum sp.]
MQHLSIDRSRGERRELRYARTAWRAFLRLGEDDRARVRAFAEAVPPRAEARELAPGLLSCRTGSTLRIVYAERVGLTTILALTGGENAP